MAIHDAVRHKSVRAIEEREHRFTEANLAVRNNATVTYAIFIFRETRERFEWQSWRHCLARPFSPRTVIVSLTPPLGAAVLTTSDNRTAGVISRRGGSRWERQTVSVAPSRERSPVPARGQTVNTLPDTSVTPRCRGRRGTRARRRRCHRGRRDIGSTDDAPFQMVSSVTNTRLACIPRRGGAF